MPTLVTTRNLSDGDTLTVKIEVEIEGSEQFRFASDGSDETTLAEDKTGHWHNFKSARAVCFSL